MGRQEDAPDLGRPATAFCELTSLLRKLELQPSLVQCRRCFVCHRQEHEVPVLSDFHPQTFPRRCLEVGFPDPICKELLQFGAAWLATPDLIEEGQHSRINRARHLVLAKSDAPSLAGFHLCRQILQQLRSADDRLQLLLVTDEQEKRSGMQLVQRYLDLLPNIRVDLRDLNRPGGM